MLLNSGIGLGIAQEFKKEGAVGAVVGRNQKTLDSSSELLSPNYIGIQTDVTKTEDLESIFKETENKENS